MFRNFPKFFVIHFTTCYGFLEIIPTYEMRGKTKKKKSHFDSRVQLVSTIILLGFVLVIFMCCRERKKQNRSGSAIGGSRRHDSAHRLAPLTKCTTWTVERPKPVSWTPTLVHATSLCLLFSLRLSRLSLVPPPQPQSLPSLRAKGKENNKFE